MSDAFKPTPDPSKSAEVKNLEARKEQIRKARAKLKQSESGAQTSSSSSANSNPVVNDETYGSLREENRIVMRQQIALNIDNFRASTETFVARPQRTYPTLPTAIAPFFSVIIPNYNGVRFLPTVLDALRQQTLRDFEVILADDASVDDSVPFVEANYPEVRLLINRHNEGFVRTCNMAVDAARGRLVVLLNNDTEPEPSWLAELAKVVCANPQPPW